MVIERCIEVYEVREEASCRYLACELVKVVVAVFRKVAYASLLLPDLYREDGCRTVSYTFICCVEELTDDAASLSRCVRSVVDGDEYDLVTSTLVD